MVEKFDILILEFIQRYFQCSFLDWIMNFLSFLGEMAFIWFLIMIIYASVHKRKRWILILAGALLINHFLCSGVLKNLIRRIRPYQSESNLISHAWNFPDGYSFPSGHSSSSFCAATILTKCCPLQKIFWHFLAGCIAFSRIYLNVHYPSDILCGAIFGTLIAHGIWHLMNHHSFKEVNKSLRS